MAKRKQDASWSMEREYTGRGYKVIAGFLCPPQLATTTSIRRTEQISEPTLTCSCASPAPTEPDDLHERGAAVPDPGPYREHQKRSFPSLLVIASNASGMLGCRNDSLLYLQDPTTLSSRFARSSRAIATTLSMPSSRVTRAPSIPRRRAAGARLMPFAVLQATSLTQGGKRRRSGSCGRPVRKRSA